MTRNKFNFVAGIIFIIFCISIIKYNKKIDINTLSVKAQFNRIDGLQIGSDLRLSGVQIGQVEKISIINNKPMVYFVINKNYMIPTDSSISIQTDGLFGNKYAIIEPGGSEDNINNGDQIIFTEDSILVEDLLRKIINLGENRLKKDNL
ncbi:MAG: hypothetical protein CMP25_01005 [Rickettsiales bacterium]|nr:hypothetical protein [Rickettsiales bacterium]